MQKDKKLLHFPNTMNLGVISTCNIADILFLLGVQQGSQHGESRQSQARKAIIRMLGKY